MVSGLYTRLLPTRQKYNPRTHAQPAPVKLLGLFETAHVHCCSCRVPHRAVHWRRVRDCPCALLALKLISHRVILWATKRVAALFGLVTVLNLGQVQGTCDSPILLLAFSRQQNAQTHRSLQRQVPCSESCVTEMTSGPSSGEV